MSIMAQDATDETAKHRFIFKNHSNISIDKCKQVVAALIIPQSKKCIILGIEHYKEKLVPRIHKAACCVGVEIVKVHNRQNWFKRCGGTMLDTAAGLGMAMLTAKIVQNYVEVKEFGNLWGLLATHHVVSKNTYEVLSFVVEFFVALIVFTLTEHYLEEYRQRKNTTEKSSAD